MASAEASALRYLHLPALVLTMSEEEAVAVQREAASSAVADTLVEYLRQDLADLRSAFPSEGLRYRIAPLAVRSSASGPGRAEVEVWFVGVVTSPDFMPYEEWSTALYDLVWERDAWRMEAESVTPGPRPAPPAWPGPSTSEELESSLNGFVSVGPS